MKGSAINLAITQTHDDQQPESRT